jgi:hypothetical protein
LGDGIRLQVALKLSDLALFDLALNSNPRGRDLVALKVCGLLSASGVRSRVLILERKTGCPVQFELTEQSRKSLANWIEAKGLSSDDWLISSGSKKGAHLSTRQYARLAGKWPALVGLDPAALCTHSVRRTKLLTGMQSRTSAMSEVGRERARR